MEIAGTLIFRLGNFFILAFFLLRVMVRSMRQFLFARHQRIRKQMVESIVALKTARVAAAQSREKYDELPRDIAARRAAISARTAKECEALTAEARFKADQILEGARRLALEEKQRAEQMLKERILDGAFDLVGKKLSRMSGEDIQSALARKGLDALAEACPGR